MLSVAKDLVFKNIHRLLCILQVCHLSSETNGPFQRAGSGDLDAEQTQREGAQKYITEQSLQGPLILSQPLVEKHPISKYFPKSRLSKNFDKQM